MAENNHGNLQPSFLEVISYNPYIGGSSHLDFSMGFWGPREMAFTVVISPRNQWSITTFITIVGAHLE